MKLEKCPDKAAKLVTVEDIRDLTERMTMAERSRMSSNH